MLISTRFRLNLGVLVIFTQTGPLRRPAEGNCKYASHVDCRMTVEQEVEAPRLIHRPNITVWLHDSHGKSEDNP